METGLSSREGQQSKHVSSLLLCFSLRKGFAFPLGEQVDYRRLERHGLYSNDSESSGTSGGLPVIWGTGEHRQNCEQR